MSLFTRMSVTQMSLSARTVVTIAVASTVAAVAAPTAVSATADRLRAHSSSASSGLVAPAAAASGPVVTLIGQTTIPANTDRSTIYLRPPACASGQVFSATQLSLQPSPDAQGSNGVHWLNYLLTYGAYVPIRQRLSDGTLRTSELSVANDSDPSSDYLGSFDLTAQLPSPVPVALNAKRVPVTVIFVQDVGHQADTVYNVQVGGRCFTAPTLPS